MATATKTLSRKQIGERLLALGLGESFTVTNHNERVTVNALLSAWNMLVGSKRKPPVVRTWANGDGTFTVRREK